MQRLFLLAVALCACGESVIDSFEPDASIAAPADASIASVADAAIARPDASMLEPDASVVPPSDDWPADWSAREDAMLVLVNAQRTMRTRCGARSFDPAPALSMNAALRLAARLHSQDMADQDYFDHDAPDGRDPWDRIREAGYEGFGVGENIAAGNSTAEDTFQQWLHSPGHCANMMSSDATEIGIGYAYNARSSYGHYWTQTFGAEP